MVVKNASISAIESGSEYRLRNGTSPISAKASSAFGVTRRAWWYGPIRSIARTARGPRRLPARLVTARSIGTPTRATSSPVRSPSARYGASSRVEIPA